MTTLLSLGHGYSARAPARRLVPQGWRIHATTRSAEKAEALKAEGVIPHVFPGEDLSAALGEATHLLVSAGPDEAGDPMLRELGDAIARGAASYGCQTFDQSLYGLYSADLISYDDAILFSSNPDDLALRISGVVSSSSTY